MKKKYRVTNTTDRPIVIGFAPRQDYEVVGGSQRKLKRRANVLLPKQECTAEINPVDVEKFRILGDLAFVEVTG